MNEYFFNYQSRYVKGTGQVLSFISDPTTTPARETAAADDEDDNDGVQ